MMKITLEVLQIVENGNYPWNLIKKEKWQDRLPRVQANSRTGPKTCLISKQSDIKKILKRTEEKINYF